MTKQTGNALFHIVAALQNAKISFSLSITREDAVSVLAVVPGERWEIDVFSDGTTEVEVFHSEGKIGDASQLDAMIQLFRISSLLRCMPSFAPPKSQRQDHGCDIGCLFRREIGPRRIGS